MNIGILIVARLKSQRLPRKVSLKIAGRSMLAHQIDRLSQSKLAKSLAIITSPLSEDDDIAKIAEQENVECFRGEPDDVLKRINDAMHHYDLDVALIATADNPFVDPPHADKLGHFLVDNEFDFAMTDSLPLGTNVWALTRDATDYAMKIKATSETEFWVTYFLETGVFKCGHDQPISDEFKREDLRLTVDYEADYELVRNVIETLGPAATFSLADVIKYLDDTPELRDSNLQFEQRAWQGPVLTDKSAWPDRT